MRNYLIFIVNFCCFSIFGQELPPIVKYESSLYKAGNQNWMVSQDKNHFIYFANNDGLLEYNGSTWKLYPSPNNTIIRSVNVIGDKIYTGCYMEFGFWTRNTLGKLQYTSLSAPIRSRILDDEQFWNVISYDQIVIFQSLNRIYVYDSNSKKYNIIIPKNNILKSFKVNNSIFYQTNDYSLYEIENGQSKLLLDKLTLKNNKIINLFSTNEGLLIHTQSNGFYNLVNNKLSKFETEADKEMNKSTIYSTQKLANGNFAVGTISNGIFILTNSGKLIYHITQNKGLVNNTVLSLFEDIDNNLWVGLDNGINCINLNSPIKSFIDNSGTLGTVYASIIYNQNLYIGTNQGLFYKELNNNNGQFQFIDGTKGQVWSLFIHDNKLFCGHDSGTYIINKDTSFLVFSNSGTWKFEVAPNNKNKIIQGNYNGLSVIEKVNNQWVFKNSIKGFNYSTRYFEFSNANEVYISHEYKGIFRIQLDKEYTIGKNIYSYKEPKKGKNAGLAKFNNTIYYTFQDGIFKLNKEKKLFEKDNLLSKTIEKGEYISGKLIVDNNNKLWLFTKNYIYYFTVNKFNLSIKKNTLAFPSTFTNSMLGFENICQLSNNQYLIGVVDGYKIFDINHFKISPFKIFINDITTNKKDEKESSFSLIEKGKFKNYQNNITLSYSFPEYNKYALVEYQYILQGFQEKWSEWSTNTTASFKNLPPNNYTFKVRCKVSNSIQDTIATYSFKVQKTWFTTNFSLVIYCCLVLILLYFLKREIKKYYHKQREKLIEENNLLLEIKELENEQQLIKIKNEKLTQDVDAKNKELAVSTMSLIKKDELLAIINEDLKKTMNEDNNRNLKSVISTITKNISKDDSWNLFKEAFDNADKDFFKKLKMVHPSLTPNDLRLCAYLRLNLSSKEISPLLNISVRSIEIKRYRLRKKLNLPHEAGLVDYILSI